MSTTARKARKRAGIPFVKASKRPTVRYRDVASRSRRPKGIGLVTPAEILAALVVRGIA